MPNILNRFSSYIKQIPRVGLATIGGTVGKISAPVFAAPVARTVTKAAVNRFWHPTTWMGYFAAPFAKKAAIEYAGHATFSAAGPVGFLAGFAATEVAIRAFKKGAKKVNEHYFMDQNVREKRSIIKAIENSNTLFLSQPANSGEDEDWELIDVLEAPEPAVTLGKKSNKL